MTKFCLLRTFLRRMAPVRDKRSLGKHSAEESENEPPAKRVQNIPNPDRKPKRKVAVLIGYCGTGYHGMQVNPPHKTIEGDLFDAFVKAGAVSADNANDIRKSSFIRAARTDKGVHAAGNVISAKLIVEDPDIVAKINAELPEQIRVWGFSRTNKAFECRKVCGSRVYEYLLPTYTLLGPRPQSNLGKKLNNEDNESKKYWEAMDAKLIDAGVGPEVLAEMQAEQNDDDLDSPYANAKRTAKKIESEGRRNYRVQPERITELREALKQFEGVHNFHNFTIGKSFKEQSSIRVMKSLTVSDPFLVNNTEWVSIKIHGQSFMLHQIRKMIALAVLVVRCNLPASKVGDLLSPVDLGIPKAPALGLLLERPMYDAYNQRLERLGREAIKFDPYEEDIEKFKQKYIYDRIYSQELAENEFWAFFTFLDTYRSPDLLDWLLGITEAPAQDTKKVTGQDKELEKDSSSEEEERATEDNEG